MAFMDFLCNHPISSIVIVMDSMFKVGFGVKVDSLHQSSEEWTSFTKAFDDCKMEQGPSSDNSNEKIVQEVKEATKLKDDTSFNEFVEHVDEETLDKMQYLHAALSETLRLYPPVPADAKFCFSDDTLPDGFSVRGGDQVCYTPYAMGRLDFLWGDDAKFFRPERWLDENGFFRPENPFKFSAFQGGPRICLGKDFAYRQMKIFSAIMLGRFVFKLSDKKKPINYKTMLTLQIDGGLHLLAFHRLL
ncbi:Cytochrome P450 [Macleaya cordata]|uniref:Cytochrome P450 n=1 Tax=Macleaya cordata TaxID=56857 RepID=A0A200QB86_MACCD|nr:Cytochrome P450 [Macleaya cordata]